LQHAGLSASRPREGPRRLNHLSLGQQKKRAKDLLKSVHAQEPLASERWRHAGLQITDPRLHEAQRVIARENGFRKWEELKAHADHIRIAQQALRDGQPSALDGAQRTLHIRCGTDIMHKLAIAGNDLSLSEYTTLRILQEKGSMTAARLFGWFQNHYDPLPGMGDSFYYKLVQGLADANDPAISLHRRGDKPNEWDLALLPFGNRLLNYNADWLVANHIQRWVGGVFLDSRAAAHWRWDAARDNVAEIKA
jgi:hypothetical protein